MAVQTSYPGVYVAEVPSGVRTITGVSTSVTAFLGTAMRGPVNKAVTITSFSDYQRRYGGLFNSSEMSFAAKQFFQNGGTQAIIVRIAANPNAASVTLGNGDSPSTDVLTIDALDQGIEGNRIEIAVDYDTSDPDNLFNLTAVYVSKTNPADSSLESFKNLSINSQHPRYVVNVVNGSSQLISATRPALSIIFSGTSTSGEIGNVKDLIDDTHNEIRIRIDGDIIYTIKIDKTTLIDPDPGVNLGTLFDQIKVVIPVTVMTSAAINSNKQIQFTSKSTGETSSVEVIRGINNDAAGVLKFGIENGGTEISSASKFRPVESPVAATLESGNIDLTLLPAGVLDGSNATFMISLDSGSALKASIAGTALAGTDEQKVAEVAKRIQESVRSLRPGSQAFREFKASVQVTGSDYQLVLTSGTRGSASSVVVAKDDTSLATILELLVDGTATTAKLTLADDVFLSGGSESPVTDANQYASFTGNQSLRTGIFSLDGVDIFNILCLPGIQDPGILADCDAYCRAHRAFMIVDAPADKIQPSAIQATVSGTDVPHSDYAAIYYPWLQIANPLNGGALRTSAPSGTIAGLYARIDGTRGVWKAPAGIEATLNGVQRLTYRLTDAENGLLNPKGINCLRIFPDVGAVSWGSRTLAGSDTLASEWKYIPVRRTALFIEESLFRGLKWVVFEPNDEPLWAQIRLNVGAFMHDLFRQGAFQGQKKSDAYFVKCDSETTTQNDINLGRVNIWVGFAPLKPAEFVILSLQQMAGQIQV